MSSFNRRFSTSARPAESRGRLVASFTLTALIALLLGVQPPPTCAGLVLQVDNASSEAGGTGSFDVVLAATDGSFAVSGFSVELSVAAGSGVTFTGVTASTLDAPYIFTTLQSPPISFATFPTIDFIASDSSATSPGYVTLTGPPTVTFGLEHVSFAVDPGTPDGAIPVSIVIGTNTQILDVNTNLFPFTAADGTITVGTSAVPEPSTLILGGMAVAGLVFVRRRSRSRR